MELKRRGVSEAEDTFKEQEWGGGGLEMFTGGGDV